MAVSDPSALVVCDAGPLIHLDELASLTLAADLGPLVIPPAVRDEVHQHRPNFLSTHHQWLDVAEPRRAGDPRLLALVKAFSLDAGEREALLLMDERRASMLLTDDAAARLVASQLGYEVHGTIGVLVRAIRRGLRTVDEVLTLLNEIPTRSSLHIRPGLLEEVKRRVRP